MKMPSEILIKFEQATLGLNYGSATLSFIIKHGRYRYVITREESIIPNDFGDKREGTEQALIAIAELNRVLSNPQNCEKKP